jgi:hypothetical protein
MIVYTKSNARQNFAEMMKKARFSGQFVGVGKNEEEVEVLLVKRPEYFDPREDWSFVPTAELLREKLRNKNEKDAKERFLYVLYRLMEERWRGIGFRL